MAPTEISPSDFFFHFDNISFALCERRSFTMAEERILLLSQPAASICDAGQKWFRIDLLKKKNQFNRRDASMQSWKARKRFIIAKLPHHIKPAKPNS